MYKNNLTSNNSTFFSERYFNSILFLSLIFLVLLRYVYGYHQPYYVNLCLILYYAANRCGASYVLERQSP